MCVLYILRKYSKLLIINIRIAFKIYIYIIVIIEKDWNIEKKYANKHRNSEIDFGKQAPVRTEQMLSRKEENRKKNKTRKKKGEKAVNKRRRNEERESGGGKEIELTEEKRRTTDVANERKLVQTRGSREEERERS